MLKTAAGKVTVTNAKDGITATVGQYWTPRYMTAYDRFVTALGAKFDGNARVASVNMFGTSLIYDEPWITGGAASGAALYSAGLTKDKVVAAQNAGLDATVTAFPHTVVEMPLHGQFTYPVAGGQKGTWADGIGLANAWDAKYGSRVIFTDYGWGQGDWTAAASSLATAPKPVLVDAQARRPRPPDRLPGHPRPGCGRGQHDADRGRGPRGDRRGRPDGCPVVRARQLGYFTVDEAAAFDAGLKANVKVVLGSVGHRPPCDTQGAGAVRDPSGIPEHLPAAGHGHLESPHAHVTDPAAGARRLRWLAGLRTAVIWLAGVTVLSLAVGFVAKSLTTLVDEPVFAAVDRAGTNDWTDVLSTLTKMGNVWQTQRLAAVLAVVLAVWLWRRGQRWWMPLVVLPLTWIVSRVMQFGVAWIVDRDRDAISLLGTNVGAFPPAGSCASSR